MMENELRIRGNMEGELLCPGQGAQPCLDPCPQSQEWAGAWVEGAQEGIRARIPPEVSLPNPQIIPLSNPGATHCRCCGWEAAMAAEVWGPLSNIPLRCPGNARWLLGILQTGERREKVHQSLLRSE